MTTCEHLNKVHAYHDGELPEPQRRAIEAHLRECRACAAELAWLERSREQLRSVDAPPPVFFVERLQRRMSQEPMRPALRLAWSLTAAAAAILVACVVQLSVTTNTHAADAEPATWEVLAIAPADVHAAPGDELQLAAWIARDLGSQP